MILGDITTIGSKRVFTQATPQPQTVNEPVDYVWQAGPLGLISRALCEEHSDAANPSVNLRNAKGRAGTPGRPRKERAAISWTAFP